MKPLTAKLLVFAFVCFVFARIAHGASSTGAPIPPVTCVCTPYIVGEDRVRVGNSSVVLIYTKAKVFRNDRIYANSFGVVVH